MLEKCVTLSCGTVEQMRGLPSVDLSCRSAMIAVAATDVNKPVHFISKTGIGSFFWCVSVLFNTFVLQHEQIQDTTAHACQAV